MREREIESWIRDEVTKLGGLWLKFVSPGNDGVPDRVAIFPDGRTVFVELKTAHGQLSEVQKYQIRQLLQRHQQVCLVYGDYAAREFVRDMAGHVVSSMVYRNSESYVLDEDGVL
jgi:hypothetical protein